MNKLWIRGGFPRSFLAGSNKDSIAWREGFIRTFLQRDIPQLGINIHAPALRRFWTMLAYSHGQLLNSSELAKSMGLSDKTIKSYVDILTATYMVRQLQPWHENLKKRQIKSPKVFIRDCGLLHELLGIRNMSDLRAHPRYGASWEGFALEQVLSFFGSQDAYFWSTQRGAELDLLLMRGRNRWGFEFKCTDAPSMTKSLHIALRDLGLKRIFVVYPGKERYAVHKKVEVIPLMECIRLSL